MSNENGSKGGAAIECPPTSTTYEQACDLADSVTPTPAVAHAALRVLRDRCRKLEETIASNPWRAAVRAACDTNFIGFIEDDPAKALAKLVEFEVACSTRDRDAGDPSVGIGAREAWVLAADQGGTVLGELANRVLQKRAEVDQLVSAADEALHALQNVPLGVPTTWSKQDHIGDVQVTRYLLEVAIGAFRAGEAGHSVDRLGKLVEIARRALYHLELGQPDASVAALDARAVLEAAAGRLKLALEAY